MGWFLDGSRGRYIIIITYFPLTATANQPIPIPCGGTLTDLEGGILSPGHPNTYPDNSECVWVIQVPESYSISLEFTTFDLQIADVVGTCVDTLRVSLVYC